MNSKKASITLFVIVGVVILIIVSMFYYRFYYQESKKLEIMKQETESFAPNTEQIYYYSNDCLGEASNYALDVVGLTQSTIKSFNHVVESEYDRCFLPIVDEYKSQGYDVEYEPVTVETEITDYVVLVNAESEKVFKKLGNKFDHDEDSYKLPLKSVVKLDNGIVQKDTNLVSNDNKLVVKLSEGTEVRSANGNKVDKIELNILDRNHNGLSNENVIGETIYEIGPEDITFSKPVTLAFEFSEIELPDYDMAMKSRIGYLDERVNVWLMQKTNVKKKEDGYTASTQTTHASDWAVLSYGCAENNNGVLEDDPGGFIFHSLPQLEKEEYVPGSEVKELEHPELDLLYCTILQINSEFGNVDEMLVLPELLCELEGSEGLIKHDFDPLNPTLLEKNPNYNVDVSIRDECVPSFIPGAPPGNGDKQAMPIIYETRFTKDCCCDAGGCEVKICEPVSESERIEMELNGESIPVQLSPEQILSSGSGYDTSVCYEEFEKETEIYGYINTPCAGGRIQNYQLGLYGFEIIDNGDACLRDPLSYPCVSIADCNIIGVPKGCGSYKALSSVMVDGEHEIIMEDEEGSEEDQDYCYSITDVQIVTLNGMASYGSDSEQKGQGYLRFALNDLGYENLDDDLDAQTTGFSFKYLNGNPLAELYSGISFFDVGDCMGDESMRMCMCRAREECDDELQNYEECMSRNLGESKKEICECAAFSAVGTLEVNIEGCTKIVLDYNVCLNDLSDSDKDNIKIDQLCKCAASPNYNLDKCQNIDTCLEQDIPDIDNQVIYCFCENSEFDKIDCEILSSQEFDDCLTQNGDQYCNCMYDSSRIDNENKEEYCTDAQRIQVENGVQMNEYCFDVDESGLPTDCQWIPVEFNGAQEFYLEYINENLDNPENWPEHMQTWVMARLGIVGVEDQEEIKEYLASLENSDPDLFNLVVDEYLHGSDGIASGIMDIDEYGMHTFFDSMDVRGHFNDLYVQFNNQDWTAPDDVFDAAYEEIMFRWNAAKLLKTGSSGQEKFIGVALALVPRLGENAIACEDPNRKGNCVVRTIGSIIESAALILPIYKPVRNLAIGAYDKAFNSITKIVGTNRLMPVRNLLKISDEAAILGGLIDDGESVVVVTTELGEEFMISVAKNMDSTDEFVSTLEKLDILKDVTDIRFVGPEDTSGALTYGELKLQSEDLAEIFLDSDICDAESGCNVEGWYCRGQTCELGYSNDVSLEESNS